MEFTTERGNFDIVYASKLFLLFLFASAIFMAIIEIIVYAAWSGLARLLGKSTLATLWIAFSISASAMYFLSRINLAKASGWSNAVSELIDGFTPVVLAILAVELIVYTAVHFAWAKTRRGRFPE